MELNDAIKKGDAAFDRLIEKAVEPLRSLDKEIAAYDALNRTIRPFPKDKADALYAHLEKACARVKEAKSAL